MEDDIFPRHYQGWKKCITEKCKIPLTKEYIEGRIQILSDESSTERSKFLEKYGTHWTETVISYFKQALSET